MLLKITWNSLAIFNQREDVLEVGLLEVKLIFHSIKWEFLFVQRYLFPSNYYF